MIIRFQKIISKLLPMSKSQIAYTNQTYREFTNEEFLEDMTDPKYPNHFYYRFIRSSAGPLLA
jgi:hypothetical protein